LAPPARYRPYGTGDRQSITGGAGGRIRTGEERRTLGFRCSKSLLAVFDLAEIATAAGG
jgi:hypothetical protein